MSITNNSTISTEALASGVGLTANLSLDVVDPQKELDSILLTFQRDTVDIGSPINVAVPDPYFNNQTVTFTDTTAVAGNTYSYRAKIDVTLRDAYAIIQ